jgi:type I restriction enzyme M protein
MPRKTKTSAPEPTTTTAQALGSLLKSARDIMRKDKGLNGDLDRLPLLTWIMFLKFLDDLELQREEESRLSGRRFRSAIEKPYRWRDWASNPQGMTGDALLAFINHEEAMRPDGRRGPGLFAYLRGLTSANGDDRRDVIATVFRGVDNRMKSGYLLRDVVTKISGIHFTSSDELHTLGMLYESMLREMRDAAGDSGEFYTPRPVVRFMVAMTDPRLGETVLDPAAGTGGFLVESFNHLAAQVKTVADRRTLQERSLLGYEPKPLPYLLSQMNLLLHGLDGPQIDPGNALRHKLTEIGEKDRVDVILTNPPFGGEEEKGIQSNFPEDRQTAETALLFLQLIMRKLKRQSTQAGRPARAAVVVPNGTLSGDGVCARIKEELVRDFNLHTIVRLPNGVFAPYTPIPTNILFFDRSGPTTEIWYYDQPAPDGRKNYSKTQPLTFEEFDACQVWWRHRTESERAWKVPVAKIRDAGYNLANENPNAKVHLIDASPEEAIGRILTTTARIAHSMEEIRDLVAKAPTRGLPWPRVKLKDVLTQATVPCKVSAAESYPNFGIFSFGRGLFKKPPISGAATSAQVLYQVRKGQLIYSRLFAFEGAYGLVSGPFDEHYVSNEYPAFDIDDSKVLPAYLALYFTWPVAWHELAKRTSGMGNRRRRLQPEHFLSHEIPLPELSEQRRIVSDIEAVQSVEVLHNATGEDLRALKQGFLNRTFTG